MLVVGMTAVVIQMLACYLHMYGKQSHTFLDARTTGVAQHQMLMCVSSCAVKPCKGTAGTQKIAVDSTT